MQGQLQAIFTISLTAIAVILLSNIPQACSLGCFVCSSINGSSPDCEDTFNNTNPSYWQQMCHAGRKGRAGIFPGTACIKMTAHLGNHTVVVRGCTVDSGGVNSETELGRESHCWMVGEVNFMNTKMKGCTVACHTDGCNSANSQMLSAWGVMVVLLVVLFGHWV